MFATVETPAALTTAPTSGRLISLDVFRGATIASMMLVNNPGTWSAVYPPLEHSPWHGWTFTDTIFPFFLWIVGVAIPLSTSRRLEAGQSQAELFRHALRRAVIIFGLGFFLNSLLFFIDGSMAKLGFGPWLHEYLTTVRIPGVLQRIAICYLIAFAIFLRASIRGQAIWTGIFLVGYWLLMAFAPFPVDVHGETRWISGVLEKGANFSAYIDNFLLNGPTIGMHVFKGGRTWDPEGTVSTLPAIATCLFGILAGHLLRAKRSDAEKTAWFTVGGAVLMWLGLLMDLALPINKYLWTSSYSVFMAGLAMVCFGVYYWLIDVQGWRAWAKPLAIYGMNAIALFVLSGVIGRIMLAVKISTGPETSTNLQAWLFNKFFLPLASPINASLIWAIVYVLALYLVAWGMYRKKWFVKF